MTRCFLIVFLFAFLFPTYLLSPVINGNDKAQEDFDVKELESLRTENNKPNNSTTDVSRQENAGMEKQPEPMPTPLPKIGVPEASKSGIFRHRGITQAKKSRSWNEKAQQPDYTKYSLIHYSPSDLASYVFNTGDEEGVAVAVEELVREGLMGRTDAINYLQDVKQILTYLRDQYEQQRKLEEFKSRAYPNLQLGQRFPLLQKEQFLVDTDTEKRDAKVVEAPATPAVTTEHPHQVVLASTSEPKGPTYSVRTTARPNLALAAETNKEEPRKAEATKDESYKLEDYKRRVPQRHSNSFTLEVIYKLAKEMFTQSILRDDPTAEDTLSGLVTFLESEVGNKRISQKMKENVLDIVSAALVDSLRDYKGDFDDNRMYEESGLYQQIPEKSGSSVSKALMSEVYRKIGTQGHGNVLKLDSKNNRPLSS